MCTYKLWKSPWEHSAICFEWKSKVYMLKSSIMPGSNGDIDAWRGEAIAGNSLASRGLRVLHVRAGLVLRALRVWGQPYTVGVKSSVYFDRMNDDIRCQMNWLSFSLLMAKEEYCDKGFCLLQHEGTWKTIPICKALKNQVLWLENLSSQQNCL